MGTIQNISDKALLVSISVSKWTANVKDKKVTHEVHDKHQCANDSGKYVKQLIDKKDSAYREIQAITSEIQAYKASKTLPWLEDGIRILPSALYMEFSDKVRDFRNRFEQAVHNFSTDYEAIKDKAKLALNGLYNESDYPANVKDKFGIEVRYLPFPDQQDFRVTMSQEETAVLKSQLQSEINRSLDVAVTDLYDRLKKTVACIAEKLSDSDAIFRDSLIGNLQEACTAVDQLNLTGDATLKALNQEIRQTLAQVEPNDLRQDKAHRKAVQEQASDILAKMQGF